MKRLFLAVAGLVVMFQAPAQADTVRYDLNGPGIKANLALTFGTATDAKYPDAYEVTGISGRFSNSNNGLNIVNAKVGSLVPVNHATPEPANLLAPHDFSRFAVASGLDPVNNGFLSFDNLYWPGGSPQTASDYPFHGGILDIYGLLFTIGNGMVVNFWSNGIFGGPPDYGVAVATAQQALDYVGGVSVTPSAVPVPGSLWFLGAGLLGLVMVGRRRTAV